MEKLCVVCNKPFSVKPSHAHKRVTCGVACMTAMYRERMKGANNPHWKGGEVHRVCQFCGRSYTVVIASAADSKFCSYACAGASKRKPPKAPIPRMSKKKLRVCLLCERPIERGLRYCTTCTPRGKGVQHRVCPICSATFSCYKSSHKVYCSRSCSAKSRPAAAKLGERNPNWKGGKLSIAKKIRGCEKNRVLIAHILKRDKYTCQMCGQVGGDLEVDHIKPFCLILDEFLAKYAVLDVRVFTQELFPIALKHPAFWEKKNLRTLCRKCNWDRQLAANAERRQLRGTGDLKKAWDKVKPDAN